MPMLLKRLKNSQIALYRAQDFCIKYRECLFMCDLNIIKTFYF